MSSTAPLSVTVEESGEQSPKSTEDYAQKRKEKQKEALKLFSLLAFLFLIFYLGNFIASILKTVRSSWKSWDLSLTLLGIIVIQYLRRSFPPLYALLGPFSSIVLLILYDHLGPYTGALTYQLLKLEELIIFPTLRHLYTKITCEILSPQKSQKYWWLSTSFTGALSAFDSTYSSQIESPSNLKKILLIWMFEMTYFFNDYVCIFWFATRSNVPWKVYVAGYSTGLILEYPKTLFKFKAYTAALEGVVGSSFWDVFRETGDFRWYEIVSFAVLTGGATLFVHGLHVKMVVEKVRGWWKGEGGGEKQREGTKEEEEGA